MVTTISDRQLEIIAAAGKILTNSGVGGLTIKNLSKEMQFSESAIYRHFTSKEEIIVAMLNYLADNMDERLSSLNQSLHSEENLELLFKEQLRFFTLNPHFVVAVFSDGLMEASDRINETIFKIMAVKARHLIPIIKKGQQKGVFTNAISADELMHIVVGAFRLQMFKWRISNFEIDLKKTGYKMIQSILILIKTK